MQDTVINAAHQLGQQLAKRGWTVSCAESCTGGGIAYAITSTAGSSGWFNQGYVTYSNAAKHALLGVDETTLEQFGAVSEQTVLEMSAGCAKVSSADIAISVSGIAGPGGGSAEKPVGLVWFGIFCRGQNHAFRQVFAGDRAQIRQQAIEFALQKTLQLF